MHLGMDGVDPKRTTIVIFGRLIVMVLTINRNKGRISLVRVSNTPGTRGGPGGRDRMLAVKSRKTPEISFLAQAALHAPPEVALQCIAGHCYYQLFLSNFHFFPRKKTQIFGRFSSFYGQHSVTAAWATPSPWSIVKTQPNINLT